MSLNYFVHLACLFLLFRQINLGERARRLSGFLWGKKRKKTLFLHISQYFLQNLSDSPQRFRILQLVQSFSMENGQKGTVASQTFPVCPELIFFFPPLWIKCLDESWVERWNVLSKDGELLFYMKEFGNTGWYKWSVFPTQLDQAAQWAGGEKMNRKNATSSNVSSRTRRVWTGQEIRNWE